MDRLPLHKAPSRGWLLGNYPIIIRRVTSGGWILLPFDPTQREVAAWAARNGLDRQVFSSLRLACQAGSLALFLDAPMADPGEAPRRCLRPGVWQLAYGMVAQKAERSGWWHIYQEDRIVNRAFSLWWAARLCADRGPHFLGSGRR